MKYLITNLCSKYKATSLILMTLLFFSIKSYYSITKEEMPEVKIPIVSIFIALPGGSQEDIDNLILKPTEKELKSLNNIDTIESNAFFGYANIVVKFSLKSKNKNFLREVRDKIDTAKSSMPKNIQEPIIQEVDITKLPTLYINLYGKLNEKEMISYANKLKKIIEQNEGIFEVKIPSYRKYIAKITYNEGALNYNKISIEDIENAVKNSNIIAPLGKIEQNDFAIPVKFFSKINDIEDLKNIPIKNDKLSIKYLKDISNQISLDLEDEKMVSTINSENAIILEVIKKTGYDTIKLNKEIRQLSEDFHIKNNKIFELSFSRDSSDVIKNSLLDLENNLILATIFVILVVLFFIGKKQAIIIGTSIPITFLFSIGTLYLLGYNINIVILFGFILATGMVVDASIVIVEYADQLIQNNKIDVLSAYINSSARMLVPILSATVGIIVVYIPLLLWPGIVGEFMKYIPIVMIFVLSFSIFVAIICIPVIAFLIEKFDKIKNLQNSKLTIFENLEKWYLQKLLIIIANYNDFIKRFFKTIAGIIVCYVLINHGVDFFPYVEPENIQIVVESQRSLSLNEKKKISNKIEQKLKKFSNSIENSYAKIGDFSENQSTIQLPDNTIIFFDIALKNWKKRKVAKKIINQITKELNQIKGIKITVSEEKKGPSSGKPFKIQILEESQEKLKNVASQIEQILEENDNLYNNTNSISQSKRLETEIIADATLLKLNNITSNQIYKSIATNVNGYEIGSYNQADLDYKVKIFLDAPKEHQSLNYISSKVFLNNNKELRSIGNALKIQTAQKENKISKVNGFYSTTFESDIKDSSLLMETTDKIITKIKKSKIINENQILLGSDLKDQKESGSFLANAFLIAIFIKFLILVWQYNSILYAGLTMSNIIIAISGVFALLILTFKSFNVVMSGLGIVSITGIVVSNNILFIDTYQQFKKQFSEIKQAIFETAKSRFRAILMTSITSIIGLLPMILNISINFFHFSIEIGSPTGQWWSQLATTIAGGLLISTISSLTILPALLMYFDTKK